MNNTCSQVESVVKAKNDIFFYLKASKMFIDLTIIIKINDKRDLVVRNHPAIGHIEKL